MNKTVIALLGASALLLSTASIAGGTTTVGAADMDANNAAGLYISGNVGYGGIDLGDKIPLLLGFDKPDKAGFAWSTAIGYQFNRYVAVEGGYIQFADVKYNAHADDSTSLTQTTDAADLAVKGIYPFNNQVSVFAKVGLAVLSHSAVKTVDNVSLMAGDAIHQVVPLFGVGASYNFTPNWAVSLQGLATTKAGDFDATYTGLVGLSYKFS